MVAGCCVRLPEAKARTTALLFPMGHHCQSKFGNLSHHGLGGRTSSSTIGSLSYWSKIQSGSNSPKSTKSSQERGWLISMSTRIQR